MNGMADPGIDLLEADLAALQGALEDGDDGLATRIAGSHDRHLREYIERVGANAAVDGLRHLLGLQNALTQQMLARRDQAAAMMRAQRASRHAASTYKNAREL